MQHSNRVANFGKDLRCTDIVNQQIPSVLNLPSAACMLCQVAQAGFLPRKGREIQRLPVNILYMMIFSIICALHVDTQPESAAVTDASTLRVSHRVLPAVLATAAPDNILTDSA